MASVHNNSLAAWFITSNSLAETDLAPEISIALHSFVTAGVLATSLAAAVLSLSSANLAAVGTLAAGSTDIVVSNPSMNLQVRFPSLIPQKIPRKSVLHYLCGTF